MQQYLDLGNKILTVGRQSDDRTGTGTRKLFGDQLRFDLQRGFPLLTTKFVPFKLIRNELLWILSGSTNNEDLRKLNGNDKPTIWEEWAIEGGDLGPIYGAQFRRWYNPYGKNIDQIADLIDGLRKNPFSRRHIVSAWNPADLPDERESPKQNAADGRMALAPCHAFFQMVAFNLNTAERMWYYERMLNGGFNELARSTKNYDQHLDELGVPRMGLSCKMTQRSADYFLGVPFNIGFYALLTEMVAQVVGMVPMELIVSFGDIHIYNNLIDQVSEQLTRSPNKYDLPKLVLTQSVKEIDDFQPDDIGLTGYQHYPAIAGEVSY